MVTGVDLGTYASIHQGTLECLGLLEDGTGIVALEDRHDHHLGRRQLGRQHKPLIIAVCHHQTPHKARGHPPGRVPTVLLLALFGLERELELLGEVLAQEV